MQKQIRADFACFICLLIFLLFTALEILLGIFPQISSATYYYILAILQIFVFTIASLILRFAAKQRSKEFMKLRPFRLKWLPLTIFAAVTSTLGAALINLLLINLPIPEAYKPEISNAFSSMTTDPFAPLLAVIIVPAIFEEMFIHGAVLTSLSQKNVFRGVLLCAFIFAMLHSSPTNFLGPLFAAFIYGYLVVATNSVYPAMIAHLINNLLSSSILIFGQNFFDIGYNKYFLFAAIFVFLISTFLFLCCLEPLFKKQRQQGAFIDTSRLIPISIIVFAFLWVAKMVLRLYNII